ncbi:hypothetical protein NOR_08748 [Metarhizium rileyi]|uniref:Uncharacterized protein n=1 Tax=Metarhizium rileyi (strain RCEF 4871) TaxID=1649241 RepID=A0A166VQ98_METRR|nr:hypothetical protein NOR_08748 [Metarhizium rileyi RCEF 4871]
MTIPTLPLPPLNQIVGLHRKAVKCPLLWTAEHLDWLGCRFDDFTTTAVLPDAALSDHANLSNKGKDSHAIKHHGIQKEVERLAVSSSPEMKSFSIKKLLVGDKLPFRRSCAGPEFFYAGRPVHRPPYVIFYPRGRLYEPNNQGLPLTGYIHYSEIKRQRRKYNRRQNRSCSAPDYKFWDRLSRITPVKWSQDPYLFCILLSIAQRQSRSKRWHHQHLESPYRACLLVTNESDCRFIYLFELSVMSEHLKIFERPDLARTPTIWPTIKCISIPFEPYFTFQSRILAAFGD